MGKKESNPLPPKGIKKPKAPPPPSEFSKICDGLEWSDILAAGWRVAKGVRR